MITITLTETEAAYLDHTLENAAVEAESEAHSTAKPLYIDFLRSCEARAADIRAKIKTARPE